jgi:hypothetical protein
MTKGVVVVIMCGWSTEWNSCTLIPWLWQCEPISRCFQNWGWAGLRCRNEAAT